MMDKDDGGAAFPLIVPAPGFQHAEFGMSLRDYFAAAALQGFCANSYNDGANKPICLGTAKEMAELSYEHADAMLAEREE